MNDIWARLSIMNLRTGPGQQLRDIKTKLKGLKLNDHPDFKEYF